MGCGGSTESAGGAEGKEMEPPQDQASAAPPAAEGEPKRGEMETLEVEGPAIPRGKRARRLSVSAEPVDMAKIAAQPTRVIMKTDAEKARIRDAVSDNFMFKNLDSDQLAVVINAMEMKKFAKDEYIIKSGEDGNDFYLLDTGMCHCFLDLKEGPKMVKEYNHGESFGELALMYNTPRAASILAMEDCITWAMDRLTFRKVVMGATYKKRAQYEKFLESVGILESLDKYEKSKVADCLSEVKFVDGDFIIKEGDTSNDNFYFLADGVCIATKVIDDSGAPREVMRYKVGDYFGELALLTSKPRAANVVAVGDVKVAYIDKSSFERLLGPAQEILQKEVAKYAAAEKEILAKK